MDANVKQNPWIGLYQQVAALGGTLALLTMLRDIVRLRQFMQDVLDAWERLVRPISNFLFGWIDIVLGIDVPEVVHDFWMVGILLYSGSVRGQFVFSQVTGDLRKKMSAKLEPLMLAREKLIREKDALIEKEFNSWRSSAQGKKASEKEIMNVRRDIEQKVVSDGFDAQEYRIRHEWESERAKIEQDLSHHVGFNRHLSFLPEFKETSPISIYVYFLAINMIAWPYVYANFIRKIFSIDWSKSIISKEKYFFDILAPFVYAILLILLSYFLFFLGVA